MERWQASTSIAVAKQQYTAIQWRPTRVLDGGLFTSLGCCCQERNGMDILRDDKEDQKLLTILHQEGKDAMKE
jgi:hypothetical protein